MADSINRRLACLTVAIIIIISLAAVFLTEQDFQNKYRNHLWYDNQFLADSVVNIVSINEEFANYAFDTIGADARIKELLAEANDAGEKERSGLRIELYSRLENKYELLSSKYHFEQIQFLLANGDSFLRFNSPQKYGDNLLGVRKTINISCKERRYTKGFEVGRIFAGYRFVYPIWHRYNWVGCMEISLSPACILEELYARHPDRHHGFLLDRQAMLKCVFENEQDKYVTSLIADDYVQGKDVQGFMETNTHKNKLYEDARLLEKLKKEIAGNLGRKKSFFGSVKHDKNRYSIQYCAVNDMSGEPVAYFYSIYDDLELKAIIEQKWKIMALIIVITFLLSSFILFRMIKEGEIRRMAMTDQLTGLYNRYSFYEIAEKELQKSKKNKEKISIGIIDIDHFKEINDIYGHLAGDGVLENLAVIAGRSLRSRDIFARFGGDEFIVMLPETSGQEAMVVMERLRKNVEDHPFPKVKKITISGGVTASRSGEKLDDAIRRADEALYQAKYNGRNRVLSLFGGNGGDGIS